MNKAKCQVVVHESGSNDPNHVPTFYATVMIGDKLAVPAGSHGTTELEAVVGLAELLGDFVVGHKETIRTIRSLCSVDGLRTVGCDSSFIGTTEKST